MIKGSSRVILLFMIVFYSCTDARMVSSYANKSYCDDVTRENGISLSNQLSIYSDSMQTKTGTSILESGMESMIYRAWFCEHAEKSIDVQYFIFSLDRIGLIGIDYLVRAAERGVKVRIIIDDLLLEKGADELLALNSLENFSVKVYNPSINKVKNLPKKLWNASVKFKKTNHRMHNKTFIVDGNVAITGGRNVANEYFGYNPKYNFRDRDILLLGGVASQVQNSFDQFWNSPMCSEVCSISDDAKKISKAKSHISDLHQFACDPLNFTPETREAIKKVPLLINKALEQGRLTWEKDIRFVSDIPGKNIKSGMKGGGLTTDELIKLVMNARNSIEIQTPYLVTTELGLGLLHKAIENGVKVRILTNSVNSTDNYPAYSAYQKDRYKLIDMGVELYEFRPDAKIQSKISDSPMLANSKKKQMCSLHAKSMVVDDSITVVGTFNFDPRSANLNTECVTIINSPKVACGVLKYMEEEFMPENSWKVTKDFNPDKRTSKWKRIKIKANQLIPRSIL